MFGIKSRKQRTSAVSPVEATEGTDRAYRLAWGFTALQWHAMTPEQRKDYRDRVAYADMRVNAVGKGY